MDVFLHQVLSGLATGGIYASLALALVMIYQATHLVNFAQGEIAMFSTYIAWSLMQCRRAVLGGVLRSPSPIAFVLGVVIERIVIRPVENAPVLSVVIVFIGAARDPEQHGGLDLHLHHQAVPEPVPGGAAVRQPLHVAARARRDRRHAGRAGAAVRVLPLHAARPRDARRRAEPGVEPAGRHPRRLDAGARLGPRRGDRRGRRHDGRADRLPRPEHDGRASCSTRSPPRCWAASTARGARCSAASSSACSRTCSAPSSSAPSSSSRSRWC